MPTSLPSRGRAATAAALLALASLWAVGPTDPASADTTAQPARVMENLGRGVVAVRSSSTQVLVSWRLLGLDPEGIGFNVYRSTAGGTYTRLNASALTAGTNYTDTSADLTESNSYRVTPVVGGQEQTPSSAFTLTANHA
ncbi:MAG: hypothetical protein HOY76_25805, partial [Streptomyces sp.]|nr:hypothetical protein [Streptomyces sp.]